MRQSELFDPAILSIELAKYVDVDEVIHKFAVPEYYEKCWLVEKSECKQGWSYKDS